MSIKDIKKDEVRGFKISGDAISELLWELLNKSGDMLLDLPTIRIRFSTCTGTAKKTS